MFRRGKRSDLIVPVGGEKGTATAKEVEMRRAANRPGAEKVGGLQNEEGHFRGSRAGIEMARTRPISSSEALGDSTTLDRLVGSQDRDVARKYGVKHSRRQRGSIVALREYVRLSGGI